MDSMLLWLNQLGIVLFILSGLAAAFGCMQRKDKLHEAGLFMMAVLGPCAFLICWEAQELFRQSDAVFWGRLMAGDVSKIWAVGSVGIIVGSGLALGALSLRSNKLAMYIGAFFFACSWYVFYQHPTPHYVPMPAWVDKLIWFINTVGGAALCIFVFIQLQSKLKPFLSLLTFLACVAGLASSTLLVSQLTAQGDLDISAMTARERIESMGCLSCHTMGGVGYPIPGDALESVAARSETTLKAFLAKPDKETAEKLGIRKPATGEMAGVALSSTQIDLLTEALIELFDVQPPSDLGPGTEAILPILTENSCLDCHGLGDKGAPGGGLGGPLEHAARYSHETLVKWLQAPSADNAKALEIRTEPMGAMEAFPLNEEESHIMADWIRSLRDE
jgi:mono/diheme cytochrome c family protein